VPASPAGNYPHLRLRKEKNEISVTRSIVFQVVGPCKTEASQKPIPLDAYLAEALRRWQEYTPYRKPDDWIFASPATSGKNPYWGQTLMRSFICPAAVKIGIAHIGWHTFRHTYSSLLRATKADIKVMQELLRHASSRVTWTHILKPSQFTNGELRVGSFACFAHPRLRLPDLAEMRVPFCA
jgi:integrase